MLNQSLKRVKMKVSECKLLTLLLYLHLHTQTSLWFYRTKTLPPTRILYTQASFNILWDPSLPVKTRKTEPVPACSHQYYCTFYLFDISGSWWSSAQTQKHKSELTSYQVFFFFFNIRRHSANKPITFNVIYCVHKCFGNSISLLLQVKDSIWVFSWNSPLPAAKPAQVVQLLWWDLSQQVPPRKAPFWAPCYVPGLPLLPSLLQQRKTWESLKTIVTGGNSRLTLLNRFVLIMRRTTKWTGVLTQFKILPSQMGCFLKEPTYSPPFN